jgi:hypothetical protein
MRAAEWTCGYEGDESDQEHCAHDCSNPVPMTGCHGNGHQELEQRYEPDVVGISRISQCQKRKGNEHESICKESLGMPVQDNQ